MAADDKDIMLDKSGDLLIENGDFVVDYSLPQEGRLILLSDMGDWRQSPTLGVGLKNYLKKKITQLMMTSIAKKIRIQFEADSKALQSEVKFQVDDNNQLLGILIDEQV
jgi:hypothetical protein